MIFTKFQKLSNFFTCWKKLQKLEEKSNNAPLFSSSFFGPHLTSINPSYPLGVELRLTGKEKWGNHTWYLSKKWGWKERSIIVCIRRAILQLMGGRTGIFLFLILAIFFNMWKNYSIFESKKVEIASSWHSRNAVDFKFQLLFEKFVKEEKGCSPPRIRRAQKKGRKYIAIQT